MSSANRPVSAKRKKTEEDEKAEDADQGAKVEDGEDMWKGWGEYVDDKEEEEDIEKEYRRDWNKGAKKW